MQGNDDIIVYVVEDIESILHLGRTKAYQLMSSDAFPSFRLNRRLYVTKPNFEKWLQSYTKKTFKF